MALRRFWQIYANRPMAVLFYMGFASGLPLLLTLSTLSAWLSQSGVNIKTIGLFALVGLPYSVKFLWAPFKDAYDVPLITRYLGHRLAWIFVTQLSLAAAIWMMGSVDPTTQLWWLALAAVAVSFLSASQDIVIDAYRIELQQHAHLFGSGAAMQSFGYRMGMLVAGAGALYLAADYSWDDIYRMMAAVMAVCAVGVWFCPKSQRDQARGHGQKVDLNRYIIEPVRDFIRRSNWIWIAAFILLYKLGDALATSLATPFYLELQFTTTEIATITKIFGPAVFLLGGFIGGAAVRRIGLMPSLLVFGIMQMLSNLMFSVLAIAGHDMTMLTATIAIENLSSGMGAAAFVAYLSALCNQHYTASQYAILSSMMAAGRTLFSSSLGYVVAQTGWVWFFVLTTFAAIPGLLVLCYLMRRKDAAGVDYASPASKE